jgi:subtilisin family serine protease
VPPGFRSVIVSVSCMALGLALLAAPPALGAQPSAARVSSEKPPERPEYVEGEIIVAYEEGVSTLSRKRVRASITEHGSGVTIIDSSDVSPLAESVEVIEIPPTVDEEKVAAELEEDPRVRFAEPNYILDSFETANDPYFTGGQLWGMYGDASSPANQFGSQAAEAWAAGTTGSDAVYIGVIDEGVQFTHPDLASNIWANPYDPVNGFDDDGNGYVDDEHGWDFVSDDRTIYDGTGDDHGTHVAGTIGAAGGNGVGVAGVNWNVTLIGGKFLGSSGGSTTGAIQAIDYMTDLKTRHGLNIVATSNSWGGGGYSQALLEAINRGGDAGILFVAAAGNNGVNIDGGGFYPAGYSCTTTAAGQPRGWDCVVSVAAIDSGGGIASFSNYGAAGVDLGAPGVSVMSTLPADTYGSYSGTSMATPHVSGAAALCAASTPGLTAQQIRVALLGSVTATGSLAGKTTTGGRLDVSAMRAACQSPAAPVSGAPSGLAAAALGDSRATLAWTDSTTGETYHEVQMAAGTCGAPGSFARVALLGAGSVSAIVDGLSADSDYCFRVRAGNDYSGGSVTGWSNTAGTRTLFSRCTATAYSWRDAVTGGTRLGLTGDDVSTGVALPFSVNLFGAPHSSLTVSSNGVVGFAGRSLTEYNNAPIPSASLPNDIVAAYWDDLVIPTAGGVWTRTIGTAPTREFVVSWVNMKYYGQGISGGITFQLVFSEANGGVRMQYLDTTIGYSMSDAGASASAGIENFDGSDGFQISYGEARLGDGKAFTCGAQAEGRTPVFSTPVTAADGFTVNVTNYDPEFSWAFATTAGSVAEGDPSGSVLPLTVTGLVTGELATVTATASRLGIPSASASVTAGPLASGPIPMFGSVARTATGFTVDVTNYDPSFTWAVSASAGSASQGTPSGSTLPLTLTGLSPGQAATLTVNTSKIGYLGATASATGAALLAGLVPVFGTPTRSADGFTVNVTNYDPSFTWGLNASAGSVSQGTASGASLPLTVTGLSPGQAATVTVNTSKTDFAPASGAATGTALAAGLLPTFSSPIAADSGFTVNVTNYNASFAWSVTSSVGTVKRGTPSGSTLPIAVSGLSSGGSATITVTTTRSGYSLGADSVAGTALLLPPAITPTFSAPVAVAGGFTVNVTNYSRLYAWSFSTTVGAVSQGRASGSRLSLTVTGLAAGQSATLTATTTRSGYSPTSKAVSGKAGEVPSAPSGVTVALSRSNLKVTWIGSAANGGSVITGYTATAFTTPSGGSVVSTCSANARALSCTLSRLPRNTTVFVEVVARNSVGSSAPSAPRVSGIIGASR